MTATTPTPQATAKPPTGLDAFFHPDNYQKGHWMWQLCACIAFVKHPPYRRGWQILITFMVTFTVFGTMLAVPAVEGALHLAKERMESE